MCYTFNEVTGPTSTTFEKRSGWVSGSGTYVTQTDGYLSIILGKRDDKNNYLDVSLDDFDADITIKVARDTTSTYPADRRLIYKFGGQGMTGALFICQRIMIRTEQKNILSLLQTMVMVLQWTVQKQLQTGLFILPMFHSLTRM